MEKQNPTPGFPRDEHGEIFQADLTDELEPSPEEREGFEHDDNLTGEETDSQAGDDFMHNRQFPPPR
jgi:hypothetical protein